MTANMIGDVLGFILAFGLIGLVWSLTAYVLVKLWREVSS